MDSKLLALLLKDPDKGIEAIMKTYMALVYKVVEGKLSLREDIEECVTEYTLIIELGKISGFKDLF